MKKNGFFIAAGILSILEAVGLAIATIAMLGVLVLLNLNPEIGGEAVNVDISQEELQLSIEAMRTLLVVFAIMFVFFAIIAIFNATVYLKNSSKTYDELHAMSGKIITVIVLSFIVGGFICGGVGLAGYLLKPQDLSSNSGETTYNQTTANNYNSSNSEEIGRKLQQLKDMRDGGIISDEEYQKAREDVLKRF